MESIRTVFKSGNGPSSSHTMGPQRGAKLFLERVSAPERIRVSFFGSLGATGRGHLSDKAVLEVFEGIETEIRWISEESLQYHPNGMRFEQLDSGGTPIFELELYSIGGGELVELEPESGKIVRIPYDFERSEVYSESKLSEILEMINPQGLSFWDYVLEHEGMEIVDFLSDAWETMKSTIASGLEQEGILPGGLSLSRKAASRYVKSKMFDAPSRFSTKLFAYALAMSEENAAGNRVVTAPTCGSCGVLPAVLLALKEMLELPEKQVISALGTAGLFGLVAKTNGSVSGAEVGCQGEIGVACAMGAAAAAKLLGGTPPQIEYAAEIGLEHHLGLTCDPVEGLVQIPCIERNALAATTAFASAQYAILSDGRHQISFDEIVDTMLRTGKDMNSAYRETSIGGLAIVRKKR